MAFSRREYWSGLPCPLQEIFLTQGLNPGLLHRQAILYRSATREASLVQGKEQIGSRRAKMLPSLFSFQGLTLPPRYPLASPAFRQDPHSGHVTVDTGGMLLGQVHASSSADIAPPQSSLLPTGRGGTFAQKTACEAAEPKPVLGVVGPSFTSEETGSEGHECFPTGVKKKNHETYPTTAT